MAGNIAIYPGTFDPVTLGHLDIIERGLKLFDGLIVAVAASTPKDTLFGVKERLAMLSEETSQYEGVRVETFDTLLIDYARRRGVATILRGLRVISDFEYEFQMALTNRKLAPDVETVFMMTSETYASVSSRFIKEIARLGGSVSAFVTPGVEARLKEKYGL
jgi:pantetheine-phosphate adenylyltransferase